MKFLKIAVATVFAFAFGNAYAFHSGGVAECEGCHSMHNSFEGSANVTGMAQYSSGPYLLKANDQSGACLNCHQEAPGSYHISTPDVEEKNHAIYPGSFTPGGDFAWLKKTMDITVRNKVAVDGNEGDRHGHNIVAADFGYTSDRVLKTAPGGTFDASKLACSSCHDPHGRYRQMSGDALDQATTGLPIYTSGSYNNSAATTATAAIGVYRILGGVGYAPKSYSPGAFTAPAPAAVAASSYNGAQTTIAGNNSGNSDRVAYGKGMSEWCANCHPQILVSGAYTSGMKGLRHPAGDAGKLTAAIVTNYNSYVRSGVTGTPPDNGYSALAPYELGDSTRTAMKTQQTAPAAAATTHNVLCLSCHRAHASGFESMARYSLINEFMTLNVNNSATGAFDTSTTENKINFGYDSVGQVNAYNGRTADLFGVAARNYCNKCHAKD